MDLFFALGAFHGLIFLATAVVIIYSDHQGFLYFIGKKQTLSHSFITWSHRLVWTGLVLMITTGLILALPGWQYYLSEPAFLTKMSLVIMLAINAVAIGKLSRKAETTPFADLVTSEKKTLLISGMLSFAGWVGAASIGFFIL